MQRGPRAAEGRWTPPRGFATVTISTEYDVATKYGDHGKLHTDGFFKEPALNSFSFTDSCSSVCRSREGLDATTVK